jgi:hypothetical protein
MAKPIWIPNQPLVFYTPQQYNDYLAEMECANCAVDEQYCFKFAMNDLLYAQFKNPTEPLLDVSCLQDYYFNKADIDTPGGTQYVDGHFYFPGSGGAILTVDETVGRWYAPYNSYVILRLNVIDITGVIQVLWVDDATTTTTTLGTITTSGTFDFGYFYSAKGWFEINYVSGTDATFDIVGGFILPISEISNCAIATCDTICQGKGECNEFSVTLNQLFEQTFGSTSFNYVLTFEISNNTTGYLTIGGAGTSTNIDSSVGTFFGNGVFTTYIDVWSPDYLQFIGVDGWDGCISNIKIGTQCRSHTVQLWDDNDEMIGIATPVYYNDYLTIDGFNPAYFFDFTQSGKCFRMTISSECSPSNGYLNNWGDVQSWNDPNAIVIGSATYTDSDSTLYCDGDGTWTFTDPDYPSPDNWNFKDNCFHIELKIKSLDPNHNEILFWFFGQQLLFGQQLTNAGTLTFDPVFVNPSDPSFLNAITLRSRQGIVEFDYIRIWYSKKCLPVDEQDLTTSCIKYLGMNPEPCMQLTQGGIDSQLAYYGYYGYDKYVFNWQSNIIPEIVEFGFLFDYSFRFSFREYIVMHMSKWEGKSDKYRYNNGFIKQTSATLEKKWDCNIYRVPDTMHDAIAVLTKLDWITLKQAGAFDETMYISLENDYAPNWVKTAKSLTTDGAFEIALKYPSTKYHNNNP